MASKAELQARIKRILEARKRAVASTEKDLIKLYKDYFVRVRVLIDSNKTLKKDDALSLQATTAMMSDLTSTLEEAGLPDVLADYARKFRPLATEALKLFGELGLDASLAGLNPQALNAYVAFASSELARSIDAKLVPTIQSALLQANYGSLTRAEVVNQVVALEDSLTVGQATTLVNDAFAQFQRTVVVQQADELELEIYQYLGPDDEITSDQCEAMLHVDTHGAEGILYKDEITVDLHEDLRQNPLIAGGHPNCFLPGTKIYGKIFRVSKAFYSGEAVTIHTRKGHRLSVTPNHPILTASGFVPAAMLNAGDQLVSHNCDIETCVAATLTGESYKYDGPALIEDIFETVKAQGAFSSRVRPSPLDLHGDAQPWNGDIDVVEMNRVLPLDSKPTIFKGDRENVFGGGGMADLPPNAQSTFNLFVDSCASASSSLPRFTHLPLHQDGVGLDSAPFQFLTLGTGTFFDAAFTQCTLNSALSDAMLALQLHDRFSAEILFDEVIDIRRHPYSGHVYDLESNTGWVIADGVCASNCRHQWTPITLEYAIELGFEPREGAQRPQEDDEARS